MQTSLGRTARSYHSVLVIGTLSLTVMVIFQAFGMESIASAKSRDEFPGRRQGGGTHWVMPNPAAAQ